VLLYFPVFEALADNGLPVNKLIVLSADGPNVNAAITNLVNKELTDSRLPMMVDIGSCSLHTVHLQKVSLLLEYCRDTIRLVVWHSLWLANFPCPALDLQLMGDH